MKIGDKEYHFAYTIGASCERENIVGLSRIKGMVELALIMNKAYEDREHFYNPEHEQDYLTRELLLAQDAALLPKLDRELSDVYARDSKVTVETAPIKKKAP